MPDLNEADLVLGKATGLTQFWIVNRRAIPLPPGNMLRFAGVKLIEGVLTAAFAGATVLPSCLTPRDGPQRLYTVETSPVHGESSLPFHARSGASPA